MKNKEYTLTEKLQAITLTYGAIQYVRIKNDFFLLFKKPNVLIRSGQRPSKTTFQSGEFPKFDKCECAIVHGDKIYIRWQSPKVEQYLTEYEKEIDDSNEFTLSNIFRLGLDEEKFRKKDFPSHFVDRYKICSKDLAEIKIFLRGIGMVNENRNNHKTSTPEYLLFERIVHEKCKKLDFTKRLPMKRLLQEIFEECLKRDELKKFKVTEKKVRYVIKNLENLN